MLSEQIRLQIAGPLEILADLNLRRYRSNSPPLEPTDHLVCRQRQWDSVSDLIREGFWHIVTTKEWR